MGFLFFGYPPCPDVFPTALYALNSVHGLLLKETGDISKDMQVVFISVDPDRDNIEKLADYTTYFNKEFIGTTADKAEIDKLTKQFAAGYIFEEETAPGVYNVSHTSAIFLVDPNGRLTATFSQPHQPSTIVSLYKKIRTFISID